MIASSRSSVSHSQGLQNTLAAADQAIEQSPVAASLIPQVAIDEFALRFSAAMIEMLAGQGVSSASPLSKRLSAYTASGIAPVTATSRFV